MRMAIACGVGAVCLAAGAACGAPGSFWSVTASTPGGAPSTWLIPGEVVAGEGGYTLNMGAFGSATLRPGIGAERGDDGDGCAMLSAALSLTSGPMMPTSFVVSFIGAPFAPTGNTFGRLTGDMKVIDLDGSGSASVTGELLNGDSLGAFVNGDPDTGTLVTSAFPSLSVVREMMATDSYDSGCITLSGIEQLSLQWKLSLSAGDQVETSALWEVCENCGQVVPLPGVAGLGFAGLAPLALRRRRN